MKLRDGHRCPGYILLSACLIWLAPPLSSQTITHETAATNEQLTAWLHSGDPRLIAWAATLARERKDTTFIALLPDWLEQSRLIRDYGYSPAQEDSRAYDAVLDALIRGSDQQTVEPNVLSELGRNYPIEAFLLLERLSPDQELPVLKEWFSTSDLDMQYAALAELAAMRLAQWPTAVPGFAARILNESEEHLTIELRARADEHDVASGTNSCGDTLARAPTPGWPVVYLAVAEQSLNSKSDTTLLTLDDDRVSYRWVPENSRGGSCAFLQPLNLRTRYEIVAHWLRKTPQATSWRLENQVTVVWTTTAAFEAAVGRATEQEQANFTSIVEFLLQSGLLSTNEAAWVRPKLTISVVCHIKPCPIPGAATEHAPLISTSLF